MNKELAIIAQNSATAASGIVAAAVTDGKVPAEEILPLFDAVRQHIFEGTVSLANQDAPASVAQVAAEAPVATPTPEPTPTPSGGGGDAGSIAFKFGKHKGETIAAVSQTDPEYLDWAATGLSNNAFMQNKVREFLGANA